MAKINQFEDLVCWQKARELMRAVYAVTRSGLFAKDFGLADQIRRSSVSIGSNIAEGFDRGNSKEFLTFLGVAKGSAAEVRSQLYTVFDIGYITEVELERLQDMVKEVSRLVAGLMKYIRDTNIKGTRYHHQPQLPTPNPKLPTSNFQL